MTIIARLPLAAAALAATISLAGAQPAQNTSPAMPPGSTGWSTARRSPETWEWGMPPHKAITTR